MEDVYLEKDETLAALPVPTATKAPHGMFKTASSMTLFSSILPPSSVSRSTWGTRASGYAGGSRPKSR